MFNCSNLSDIYSIMIVRKPYHFVYVMVISLYVFDSTIMLPCHCEQIVAGGNCDHPNAEYKFGGNNQGFGLSRFFTEVKPAIFPCTWDSGAAKWLRFRFTKKGGILARKDKMLATLSSGMNCEAGSTVDPNRISEKKILCDLKAEDVSCPVQNIRVIDAITDPYESTVCVVAFCMNEKLACDAEIQVEFYDQFAKPTPLNTIIFGCTAWDLIGWVILVVQIGITFSVFYGLFGKYCQMMSEQKKQATLNAVKAKAAAKPSAPPKPVSSQLH